MNENEVNTTALDDYLVDDYAIALNSVPPEVRAFMWSDVFAIILKVIGDTYKLNDKQREVLKSVAMETLIGTLTPVSRRVRLSDVGIVGETQDGILEAINEEIISRALVQIEEYKELKGSEDTSFIPSEKIEAPSPVQALASIKERLSQPSNIASTKRDYSLEKPEVPDVSIQKIEKPTIDPYRELPEK